MIRLELECVSDLEEMLRPRMDTEFDLKHSRAEVERLREELQSVKDELRHSQNYCTQLALQVMPTNGQANQGVANQLSEIIRGVIGCDKIAAIKHVRSMTGLGLKESKDLVEKAMAAGEASKNPTKAFGD